MLRRLLPLTALGAGLAWWLLRLSPLKDVAIPRVARDYAGAAARIAGMQAADSKRVNPNCRTRFLTHGARTPRAFGLVHGFTNCPAQYTSLAQELHAHGHNVVIPRVVHHGLSDPLSPEFADLTAEQMVGMVSELCDAFRGLGDTTVLVGFSMGGAIAAWAAQHRADVDHAVLVAPAISLRSVSRPLRRLTARLLTLLPNRFIWWDPALREARIGPSHAYPRYATHAVGQLMRLGLLVEAEAHRQIYVSGRVTVITNPHDDTVDNHTVARVVGDWRRLGGPVITYEFPEELQLIHDFMDPNRPDQQTELAYPSLLKWIDGDD